ncbi:MAG: FKBP-type peptidyl-prolyl cis-trans isomerase [Flavobacteriales bacterium]
MKTSLFSLTAAALLLGACNKGGASKSPVDLKTTMDSLSYGIGAQIGSNVRGDLHRSELDSVDVKLLLAGFQDGMDSAVKVPQEKLDAAVRAYMMKQRDRKMAKEHAEAEENLKKGQDWLVENGKKPGVTTTASGLQYEVITMGTGPKPTAQDQVEVNYRGTLIDGHEFDSSYKRGEPAKLSVQEGMIAGWSEALQLMPVGSKWKVYIPSGLGFGEQARGEDLPANSVLVFDLELLKILPKDGK